MHLFSQTTVSKCDGVLIGRGMILVHYYDKERWWLIMQLKDKVETNNSKTMHPDLYTISTTGLEKSVQKWPVLWNKLPSPLNQCEPASGHHVSYQKNSL